MGLVLRPDKVIEELGCLGLPRNHRPFEPLNHTVDGSNGRSGGRRQLCEDVQIGPGCQFSLEDWATLRSQMAPHSDLTDWSFLLISRSALKKLRRMTKK